MDHIIETEIDESLQAIASMISRTEKSKAKFVEGTAQHTLQKNRLKALQIAASLVSQSLAQGDAMDVYPKDDLKNALAPITSLISKSEKALQKLPQGTWQYVMLDRNLKALHLALPLLVKASGELNAE